jgi:hypothetical protein
MPYDEELANRIRGALVNYSKVEEKRMETLLKEGRLTPGQRLTNAGKVVSGTGKRVHDGPFAEGKEVVASFCVIKAASLDEAVEFAKACPILDYDGSVEVREVMTY